jgi:nucleoside-diphosphate-sugar epimerase
VWGPGNQTRSFLYIDECLAGMDRIMNSDCRVPVNLGSTRMISINNLVQLIANIAGKNITINNIDGPAGVMGRNSDNRLIDSLLDWQPNEDLETGLVKTYAWIKQQIDHHRGDV